MSLAVPSDRTAWGVVLLGFLAGVVGMFQTAKMSIVLVDVQREIGLDLVAASWSTTVTSLTGAILGVQAGRIAAEFGLKRTLVAALALSAVAAAATAVIADPTLFMAARILEGVGYLFVCTSAPALMAAAASPRDQGIALAIWGAFVPVSVSVMSLIGPPIAAAEGWRTLFHVSAGLAAAMTILVALAASDRHPDGGRPGSSLRAVFAGAAGVHARLYRSRPSVALAIAFAAFAALQVGLIALLPAFLIEGRGLSATAAGTVLSVTTPFAIAGTVLAGVLQRAQAPDRLCGTLGFAAMGASAVLLVIGGSGMAGLIATGIVFFTAGGVVASVVFASLPKRARTAADMALLSGLIVQFGNLGALTGAPSSPPSPKASAGPPSPPAWPPWLGWA